MKHLHSSSHSVCRHCKKNNENHFTRCVRCGKLRRDIAFGIVFGRLMLIIGIPAILFSVCFIYSVWFDGNLFNGSHGFFYIGTMAPVAGIISLLLFIGGIVFIYRAEGKKGSEA